MNTELGQFISEQIKLKKNFRLLSNIKSNIFKIKSYVKELKKKSSPVSKNLENSILAYIKTSRFLQRRRMLFLSVLCTLRR